MTAPSGPAPPSVRLVSKSPRGLSCNEVGIRGKVAHLEGNMAEATQATAVAESKSSGRGVTTEFGRGLRSAPTANAAKFTPTSATTDSRPTGGHDVDTTRKDVSRVGVTQLMAQQLSQALSRRIPTAGTLKPILQSTERDEC